MSNPYTTASCDVSVEILGGRYVNLGGEIASFKPSIEALFAEEDVYDQEYPHYTLTNVRGGIEITGLRTGPRGDGVYEEVNENGRRDAFFCVIHKKAMFLGPCGYIKVNNANIVDADGIFRIESSVLAQPGAGFEYWRFGTILPRTLNSWKNQGDTGYPAPVAEQLAVINVVDRGGLTNLQVDLNKGGNTYSLKAAENNSNNPRPGLTRGYLAKSDDSRVPSSGLTGYRWRIRTAGNASGAVFYVGLIHLF